MFSNTRRQILQDLDHDDYSSSHDVQGTRRKGSGRHTRAKSDLGHLRMAGDLNRER